MNERQSLPPVPPPPDESRWRFVRELQAPLHRSARWTPRDARKGEISLIEGVRVHRRFPDPAGILATAYDDFDRFLRVNGIGRAGANPVVTERLEMDGIESFALDVTANGLRLQSADTEGIRRGIVFIEDEMLRRGGPFLPLGRIERTPFIRTRISRCFFGPINRPPRNRDELADDADYYPEEYLNRLAHDGINGLWLTVAFKDLCRTRVIPEFGQDAERRLEKLRRTIARCAQYGIRLYPFCIEPAALPADSPALKRLPELGGHRVGDRVAICTSGAPGRQYLDEAAHDLFTRAPGLGGLIVISVGEGFTHCCSGPVNPATLTCPRCVRRQPWAVLADALAALERGIHRADPAAELISWPYGQLPSWGQTLTREAAAHVPRGVILQHNFETGARTRQLGRARILWDYWLSYAGPSAIFRDCTRAALKSGRRVSAKLQVGCSHEAATVPFVPAPGILYSKYRAMRRLGVSAAMYSWYFGSYPSLMTRAAGQLAFEPFPANETAFLRSLAQRDWGKDAPAVVRAWKLFAAGYGNYPHSHIVGYYGPMADGPAWPLYLEPRDLPLAPTWLPQFPPSGDRIGEFITYSHTPAEVQTLFGRMSRYGGVGARILRELESRHAHNPERLQDIGVARALALQFESGCNILRFYLLRESMPRIGRGAALRALVRMRAIVRRELAIDHELLLLCRRDSRLGFHSEAEGHKYYPAKIQWRMRQLRVLLRTEFPRVQAQLRRGGPLWPVYTGETPRGPIYRCERLRRAPAMKNMPAGAGWDELPEAEFTGKSQLHWTWSSRLDSADREALRTTWKAAIHAGHLYVGILCKEPQMKSLRDDLQDKQGRILWENDCAGVAIEPRRLWPCITLAANSRGARTERVPGRPPAYRWTAAARRGPGEWSVTLRIPLAWLRECGLAGGRFRMDVFRVFPPSRNEGRIISHHWVEHHPAAYRLAYNTDNPADLGWITLPPDATGGPPTSRRPKPRPAGTPVESPAAPC